MEHLDWPAAPLENPTSHSSAGAIWYMPSGPQPSARSAQLPTVDCGQMLPFPPRPSMVCDISRHFLRHGEHGRRRMSDGFTQVAAG